MRQCRQYANISLFTVNRSSTSSVAPGRPPARYSAISRSFVDGDQGLPATIRAMLGQEATPSREKAGLPPLVPKTGGTAGSETIWTAFRRFIALPVGFRGDKMRP